MTEEGWLKSYTPWSMIDSLDAKRFDRKLRLFAAACCRRLLLGPALLMLPAVSGLAGEASVCPLQYGSIGRAGPSRLGE